MSTYDQTEYTEPTEYRKSAPSPLKIIAVVGALLLALVAGAVMGSGGSSGQGVGTPAPEFSGTTPDGTSVSLSEFKGQVVVLNFWATWCPPCRAKLPSIMDVQRDLADQGVQVIGISGDVEVGALVSYDNAHNINFPTIFEGANPAMESYGIRAFPTTVIIDREGIIRFKGHGGDIASEVRKLL